MVRYTQAQITAKGNPADVPFEILRKAVKRAKGPACTADKCSSTNPLNSTTRKRPADPDSFDNLRVVCKPHNPDLIPGERVIRFDK